MNGEEMERAIEFLLKHQADSESRLARLEMQVEKTSSQIEETNNRLEIHAETQTEFIKIVTQHIEAQGAINASLRATLVRMDERLNQIDERLNRTDARLDRLAAIVEQHIVGG